MVQPPPEGFGTREGFLRAQGIPEEQWHSASAIVDPEGNGPRIYFQTVPEPKVAKNRMHMDLNASGGRDVSLEERIRRVDAERERLRRSARQTSAARWSATTSTGCA
jgi:hypothetical protein